MSETDEKQIAMLKLIISDLRAERDGLRAQVAEAQADQTRAAAHALAVRGELLGEKSDGLLSSTVDLARNLRERAERAEAALLAAQQAQGRQWQPIETAPKDGTLILLYGPDLLHGYQYATARWQTGWEAGHDDGIAWWKIEDGKFGPYDLRGPSPTHWMPLPPAPEPATPPAPGDAK